MATISNRFSFQFLLTLCVLIILNVPVNSNAGEGFINIDGGIGIGFHEAPGGASKGGLNLNMDIVPLDLYLIHVGLSAGVLSIMKYSYQGEDKNIIGFPAGLMIIKYIKTRDWNSIPYIHFTPGACYLSETIEYSETDSSAPGGTVIKKIDEKYGYGFASGLGLLIPIGSGFYIDLAMRYYQYKIGEDRFRILSSNIGISMSF